MEQESYSRNFRGSHCNRFFAVCVFLSQIQVAAAAAVVSLWYFWMCFVLLVLILATVYAVYRRSVYLKKSRVFSDTDPQSPVQCISAPQSGVYKPRSVMIRTDSHTALVTSSLPAHHPDLSAPTSLPTRETSPDVSAYMGPVFPSPRADDTSSDGTLAAYTVNPFAQVVSREGDRW